MIRKMGREMKNNLGRSRLSFDKLRTNGHNLLRQPLPLRERTEVRGITLIPNFSHRGRRGLLALLDEDALRQAQEERGR